MKKSLRNYRLFFHRMGLLFLFIPLIVLILSIVLPDRGFSEKENRVLSSLPHLNGNQIASGGFEKQFETYENDQFPLRDLWITLKAGTDRLMGKVESNGVYVGKSGYLMEEFKAPDQTQYDATVKAMTDFAQKHSDLKQYALIAPNSVNILSLTISIDQHIICPILCRYLRHTYNLGSSVILFKMSEHLLSFFFRFHQKIYPLMLSCQIS